MAKYALKVDQVELMSHLTMDVKLTRTHEMRLRVWFGRVLMRLAAWVMNCNIKIEDAK